MILNFIKDFIHMVKVRFSKKGLDESYDMYMRYIKGMINNKYDVISYRFRCGNTHMLALAYKDEVCIYGGDDIELLYRVKIDKPYIVTDIHKIRVNEVNNSVYLVITDLKTSERKIISMLKRESMRKDGNNKWNQLPRLNGIYHKVNLKQNKIKGINDEEECSKES